MVALSAKTKLIIIGILIVLLGGVILYSTIQDKIVTDRAKKQALEAFSKSWNSDDAVAERERIMHELDETLQDSKKSQERQQKYMEQISTALEKGDQDEAERLLQELKRNVD